MTYSIGDVLDKLTEDFPDITVSKIRFLESQGLIAPMRTASGFRMFSDSDITKLRWILLHQRDRFLPLKVIKEFLLTLSDDAFDDGNMPNFDFENSGTLPLENDDQTIIDLRETQPQPQQSISNQVVSISPETIKDDHLASVSQLQPKTHEIVETTSSKTRVSLLQESPTKQKAIRKPKPTVIPKVYDSLLQHLDTDSLIGATEAMTSQKSKVKKQVSNNEAVISLEAMTIETGISGPDLKELVKYGVIEATGSGNSMVFHRDEVGTALVVAPLLARGIEVRHIKNYVLFASREIGFLEHIIQDDLRRKNPESLGIAQEKARQFIQDTAKLKEMLLIKALKKETRE